MHVLICSSSAFYNIGLGNATLPLNRKVKNRVITVEEKYSVNLGIEVSMTVNIFLDRLTPS
jgi:hypothetical protein